MSTAVWTGRVGAKSSIADTALSFAARFWLLAALLGQWAFLYYIVAVYGTTTVRGDFAAWTKNTFLIKGYVAGDTAGNLSFAAHALLAGVVSFGGAMQLVPWIRSRAPWLHRWNGRVFMVTALGVSITGLYMVWIRGSVLNPLLSIAVSGNGVLIIVFAILAWRAVLRRDMRAHRAWAMRTFLVANGQWFLRVGLMSWVMINRGPVGMTKNFDGPFDYFWSFGCYLLPLAVLELYLRVKESATPRERFATAGVLFLFTLVMSIGIFAVYAFMWRPVIEKF